MADNIEEVYLNTGVADGPNGERIINFEAFRAAVEELMKEERELFEKLRRVMGLSPVYYDTPGKIANAAMTRIAHLESVARQSGGGA